MAKRGLLPVVVASLGWSSQIRADPEDFYAYYTRLDYEIPLAEAAGDIPREEPEEEPRDDKLEAEEASEVAELDDAVLKIGDTATDFGFTFWGSIDDVVVYARTLDDDEMAALAAGTEVKGELLARYRFEGDARDSSGNRHHAVLRGTAAISTGSREGRRSLLLDGGRGWALTPIRELGSEGSWAAWIRTSRRGTVVAFANESGAWVPGGRTLFIDDGRLVFDVGWVGEVRSESRVDDGEWHHVGVTTGSEGWRIYVDGKRVGSRGEGGFGESSRGPITGQYADVVVSLKDRGQLVFGRESSYRPYWKTANGTWSLKELVPRQKDVACLYAYARIVQSTAERVLVHWRYVPDLAKADRLDGAVHEHFEVAPDGVVIRTIRRTTDRLDEWRDPKNAMRQRLRLTLHGVEELSLQEASLSRASAPAVPGAPVRTLDAGKPAARWLFDEGLASRPYDRKDLTRESVGGEDCPVDGHVTLWKKGISGTALAFDGYRSKVSLPASQAPAVDSELTLEAWVALGAYPWNWAPLIHQSLIDPGPYARQGEGPAARRRGDGYYLGIDAYGYPVFAVDGKTVKASKRLETHRWTHLAATFGEGRMRVYVDGKEAGSISASGRITVPDTDLLIGLNNRAGRATDPVRGPQNHLPLLYGIEGLIDEVRIHTEAWSPARVLASYKSAAGTAARLPPPDLEPRILPGKTGPAERFGAEHTLLSYHDLWDNLWRSSEHDDLVVRFDELPASVVYWRGANGAAGWVTENNKWMEDQSTETGGPHGCSEHMADKECRHAHVRLIENTDARVVVHWRYASIDVAYLFPTPRHWTDEYHTIYPDGTAVRHVVFRGGNPGWQDVQFLNPPGTTHEDNVHLEALSLANLAGETRTLTWAPPNRVPQNPLRDACIERVNFRSEYKVFLIFQEGTYISPWGTNEQSRYVDDPFAGPWNHWPVSRLPSDGRFAVASDRLTHAAIAAADNVVGHGNMAIYGFTREPVSSLVPLARFWNRPPAAIKCTGGRSEGYRKEERAYVFTAEEERVAFTVDASSESPVVNPCLVVKGWREPELRAQLSVNGAFRDEGRDFRQGVVRNGDGTPTLVLWVRLESTAPVSLVIGLLSKNSSKP